MATGCCEVNVGQREQRRLVLIIRDCLLTGSMQRCGRAPAYRAETSSVLVVGGGEREEINACQPLSARQLKPSHFIVPKTALSVFLCVCTCMGISMVNVFK